MYRDVNTYHKELFQFIAHYNLKLVTLFTSIKTISYLALINLQLLELKYNEKNTSKKGDVLKKNIDVLYVSRFSYYIDSFMTNKQCKN